MKTLFYCCWSWGRSACIWLHTPSLIWSYMYFLGLHFDNVMVYGMIETYHEWYGIWLRHMVWGASWILGTLFETHFWYMYEALVGDLYTCLVQTWHIFLAYGWYKFHGIWYMLGEIHCWYNSWFIGTMCMVIVLVVYYLYWYIIEIYTWNMVVHA